MRDSPRFTILTPLLDSTNAEPLLQLAATILRSRKGQVIALAIIEVPEEENLSGAALRARGQRRLLRQVEQLGASAEVPVRSVVRAARTAWQGIREVAREENADLVLFSWKGTARSDRIFATTIDAIMRDPPCDVGVLCCRRPASCFDKSSILVPVRGGPHADLALDLALAVAESTDGQVTALHVDVEGASWAGRAYSSRLFEELARRGSGASRLRTVNVSAPSVEGTILQQARDHSLVFMGAPAQTDDVSPRLGAIADRIVRQADASVLVLRTVERMEEARPPAAETLATADKVEKWFAENTFHAREFEDVRELVRLKRAQALSLSLLLPTLNDEQTIGAVIRTLRAELMEKNPLLDEIVVIDGGSTDQTTRVARELGVPVYLQRGILPEWGSNAGRGEALWKGLFVLRGDIIAWMHANVKNPHPKFVYGVVAPLLREQRLKLVKGFYGRRSREVEPEPESSWLTGLTARPLINLFFPELSGVIEPLSGECAARRSLLEAMPMFAGLGFEAGLLIDTWFRHGLQAIGQSDLEEQVRRDLPLPSLERRAFAVAQVVTRRFRELQRLTLPHDRDTAVRVVHRDPDRFLLEAVDVAEAERPPMAAVPAYRLRSAQSGVG